AADPEAGIDAVAVRALLPVRARDAAARIDAHPHHAALIGRARHAHAHRVHAALGVARVARRARALEAALDARAGAADLEGPADRRRRIHLVGHAVAVVVGVVAELGARHHLLHAARRGRAHRAAQAACGARAHLARHGARHAGLGAR